MKYKINKSISSLFLVFVTVLTVMSCDNKKNNSTTIIGLITGNYKGQTISITEINNDLDDVAIDTIASASIKKGTFKFSNLKVNDPRAAKLTFGDTINTVFFLEPGLINIKINTNDTIYTEMFDGIEVRSKREGTINNELFTLYRDKRQAILTSKKYKGLQALDKTMFSPYPDLELLNQQLDKFKNESKIRDSILLKIKTDFITEHKDNMVSPFILLYEDYRFDDIYSTEQIVSFFNIFNKNLKNNRYYKATEKYAIANKNTSIGVVLNNFSLKNRNNKDVSLSSLKGKYVLIDFWAYWCKPCIASFPHLEKLLKKYKKENFEILGISSDPNNEKWIKALNQHKPSWIQVIDSKDKEVSKQFNVAKLPTTFLIDKENKVIAIDLYGDELDRELEVIFGY